MMGTATTATTSSRCDPRIFQGGHCLVCLFENPGPMPTATLNEIVAYLTDASGGQVEFDWHPVGGRPMLLYLGPYETARATYLGAATYLQQRSEEYKRRFVLENGGDAAGGWWGEFTPSKLGTLEGPEIYAAGMISIGQAFNSK